MSEEPVEFIKIIAGLIQSELDLDADTVWLYNQKEKIPPVKTMFVNVGFLGSKVFAAANKYASEDDPPTGAGLYQKQTVNMQEHYSVLVYSADSTARIRKHEIIWALIGDAAQQAMEKYSFKIGYVPKFFTDVSTVEGTSRLNSYSLAFNILCAYSRRRSTEFFDTFAAPKLVINP